MRKFKLIGYFEDNDDVRRKTKSIIVEASDDETARKYATILWPDCHKISVEMLFINGPEERNVYKDLIAELIEITDEFDARENSGNTIHSEWFATWDELCDKGIELFKKLKEPESL